MPKERFKDTGTDSIFGDTLYERIVPRDHFLVKLKELIDWARFSSKLLRWYKGRGQTGRPPYDPVIILRMLLISYLYNLSERQTEEATNLNLAIKYFVGLAVDQPAPDHSELTAFKKRIRETGHLAAFQEMFDEIIVIALEKEVKFGKVQVLDSVHTIANVNVKKDDKRQEKGKGPRDPGARWGVKHTRKVRDENGDIQEQKEYFYGYKTHASLNAENGLLTSLEFSSGEAYDGHFLPSLIKKDLAKGLPIEIVTADRSYDDSDNHVFLWDKGLFSAIRLNDYRTAKKDPNKQVWLDLKADPRYQAGLKERYKVERKFGEGKTGHGLARCRYIGLVKYAIQSYLTAMALNLKRLVRILTGVTFKGRATAQG
jgi:IS5 family transposase